MSDDAGGGRNIQHLCSSAVTEISFVLSFAMPILNSDSNGPRTREAGYTGTERDFWDAVRSSSRPACLRRFALGFGISGLVLSTPLSTSCTHREISFLKLNSQTCPVHCSTLRCLRDSFSSDLWKVGKAGNGRLMGQFATGLKSDSAFKELGLGVHCHAHGPWAQGSRLMQGGKEGRVGRDLTASWPVADKVAGWRLRQAVR